MDKLNAKMAKNLRHLSMYFLVIAFLMSLIGAGCGGNDKTASSTDTGTLSLALIDFPSDEYQAVYVTIESVEVHKGIEGEEIDEEDEGWIEVASSPGTYNLCELVNGVMQGLGVTVLETGHYSQMRLYLGRTADETINILDNTHPSANYVIDKSDPPQELPLFVPSGYETGIKLVAGFDIEAGLTKELVLDFDIPSSIVTAGRSGMIILKPTINVIDVINRPIVTGTVYTSDETTPVPGAYVSAQVYDSGAAALEDQVVVCASTQADENGEYSLILEAGAYNIVAYSDGTSGSYLDLVTEDDGEYNDVDINLSAEGDKFYIPVSVDISGEGPDAQTATVSFRKYADLAETQKIEVIFENIEDGGEVDIWLPVEGNYDIVSSSEGFETNEIAGEYIDDTYQLEVAF